MLDSRHFVIRTLLADGLIKDAEVRRATDHAVTSGGDILESIVALGIVPSRKLAIARAKVCEYAFVDLGMFDVDIRNTRLVARNVAEKLTAFPLFLIDGVATVAMLDPLNLQAIDQLRQSLKSDVDPVVADAEQLRALISRAYSLARPDAADGVEEAVSEKALTTGDEPIVAAVNQIVSGAIDLGASDIHVNPDEHDLHLRYRVDGILRSQQGPPRSSHAGLVQRLKVLAKLDTTQTRRPQDGKFRFARGGETVDIRLSLLPTIHGENVVMRLLRSASRIGKITDLGMTPRMNAWYEDAIARPNGMILVTGPTGSGKTTTLYTALNHINKPEQNIMTIEDPVEIRLPLIRQVQTNAEIGVTFAAALRSILRQDPDVVLVGEIRDPETAKIAVQAALTGHLVFSTLHTNNAIGSIARLKDSGVPLFAINNALLMVLAQRLVRKICPGCARPESEDTLAKAGVRVLPDSTFQRGAGCGACGGSGYKGRLAVYEMLRITPRVQKLIERDASQREIEVAARVDGMRSLWEDGMLKAAKGLTTIDELAKLRAIVEDDEPATGERPGEVAGVAQRIAA
mgnify:CR=1 FL=1